MNDTIKGFSSRWVSATAFGLIPLFSIPVMTGSVSMRTPSVMVYRFVFGCLGLLGVLLWRRVYLKVSRYELMEIALLALLYDASAMLMLFGYQYMPSGPATTLVFSYPIWTEVLMIIMYHEKFSWSTITAMVLVFLGVGCMSGLGGDGHTQPMGVAFELASGIYYAFYMVALSHMRVRNMGSLKLTFYVFLLGSLFFIAFAAFFDGGVEPIRGRGMLINLLMLGLVCTALSNVMLIPAVKLIGPTLTAILGAFEPLTAMVVSIVAFGDVLTPPITLGFVLIVGAVMLLITAKLKPNHPTAKLFKRRTTRINHHFVRANKQHQL